MKRWAKAFMGAVLLVGTASCLRAQPAPDIRNFTTAISFTVAEGDYNLSTGAALVTLPAAVSMEIRSNRTFELRARVLTASFSHTPLSGDPVYAKPGGDLQLNAGAGWVALSTTATNLRTFPSTSGYDPFTVDARLSSSLAADRPGTYTITVEFWVVRL